MIYNFLTASPNKVMLNVYISGQIHALLSFSQQGVDKLVFKAFGEETESE